MVLAVRVVGVLRVLGWWGWWGRFKAKPQAELGRREHACEACSWFALVFIYFFNSINNSYSLFS